MCGLEVMAWFNERYTTWCAHLSDALLGTLVCFFGFIVVDNFVVTLHSEKRHEA